MSWELKLEALDELTQRQQFHRLFELGAIPGGHVSRLKKWQVELLGLQRCDFLEDITGESAMCPGGFHFPCIYLHFACYF